MWLRLPIEALLAGGVTSVALPQTPPVSLSILLPPTVVQSPAEGQEMAFEGTPDAGSITPHTPAVSLSSSPFCSSELSVYLPTAPQLPGEAHETERRETCGLEAALTGNGACTPVSQFTF